MKIYGVLFVVSLTVVLAGGTLYISHSVNFQRKTASIPKAEAPTSSSTFVTADITNVASTSIDTSPKSTTPPTKVATSSAQVAAASAPSTAYPPSDNNLRPTTTSSTTQKTVGRIQNPYPVPPESFSTINENARKALVNIFCAPREGGFKPTSGSGVIIDPRGVILTNAHVAQYILLSESENIDLSCVIRTGSPAVAKWHAVVMYIPPIWVNQHVGEITAERAYGTGEHDYALLLITDSVDGKSYTSYPFLSVDTRQAIGFLDDSALVLSYPAELVGGFAAQSNLYAASSQTYIQKLMTFVAQTVDVISLGGVIQAQGGSSGGAVANPWDRLIGLIVTTSAGETTDQRDLRALTLSYIDRDIAVQTGRNLASILAGDVVAQTADFTTTTVPGLIKKYIDTLTAHNR